MAIGVIPSGYGVDACEMVADANNTRLTVSVRSAHKRRPEVTGFVRLFREAKLDLIWAILFIIFTNS